MSTAIRRAQDRVIAAAAASAAASIEMQASLQHLHQLQEEEQLQLRERLKQTEQQQHQHQHQHQPRQSTFENVIIVRDDETPPPSPRAFQPLSGRSRTWLEGAGEGGEAAEEAEVIACMTCDATDFMAVPNRTQHVSQSPAPHPAHPSQAIRRQTLELSPEQRLFIDRVNAGHNVFLTGLGGTGK
jgi:hypothetical protein